MASKVSNSDGRKTDMAGNETVTRASLKTPRAAAVAGILFSLSVFGAFWFLRASVPADPSEPGAWLETNSRTVALGLNLIPFSGVAFLWFIGVLRDRLGQREDRFFATVFLGSGLLFLGMLFVAAGVIGAIIMAFAAAPNELIASPAFHLARAIAYNIANVYMIKMAAVFMISLSTVTWLTAIAARWLAILGYVLALFLLFGAGYFDWAFLTFPLWVFIFSCYILIDNYRPAAGASQTAHDSQE
jgi:hypothetical protein